MDADVAVVGVGSMGSMATWRMANRGLKVLGFEQFGVGHDRSAAGGESRLFRTAYRQGADYVPVLRQARALWRELEVLSGRSLLQLDGCLNVGRADSRGMQNIVDSIEKFDLRHEVLDDDDFQKRYPQHSPLQDELAILDLDGGYLRPELSVVSAVEAAEKAGAVIHRNTPVVDVRPHSGDGVEIVTEDHTFTVGQVVISTGAWADRLVPGLRSGIRPRRIILAWFPARDLDRYTPEQFPGFLREVGNGHLAGIPSLDGPGAKVSMGEQQDGVIDPDQLAARATLAEIDVLSGAVAKYLPGLAPEPVRVSTYMDGYSLDGHSYVGRVEGLPSVVTALGFSGHGFKMAPAIGDHLARIVADGGSAPAPLPILDPNRLANWPTAMTGNKGSWGSM